MKVPMLIKRCRHGVAAMRGRMYVFGGYDAREFLNSVEVYDQISNQWSILNPMSTRRSRVGVAVSEGKIYAVGGYDGCSNLNTMEVFDPESNSWSASQKMIVHDGGVGVAIIPTISSQIDSLGQ